MCLAKQPSSKSQKIQETCALPPPPSCSTASVKPTASGCCGLVVFQGEVTEMVADNKRCLPVGSWVEWTGVDTRADNTGC